MANCEYGAATVKPNVTPGPLGQLPLLQLLPLLVFLVVDALVDDVRISILAAIVFAVAQLATTWRQTRKFDWFVVLDAALIAGMGAVSIVMEDEFFFKLKPAIIEAVSIVFMVGLMRSSDAFLAGYVGRMTPGTVLEPSALAPMRRVMGWSALYIALHIAAVLYTAVYASKSVWALVSGLGFYLPLIPVMAVMLGRAWLRRRKLGAGTNAGPSKRP